MWRLPRLAPQHRTITPADNHSLAKDLLFCPAPTSNPLRSSYLAPYVTSLLLHATVYANHQKREAGTVQATPVTTKRLLFYPFV